MRILVTGSEGTLGTPLCLELEARGHEVYRSDLMHTRHERYKRCDVRHYRSLQELFTETRPQVVYHLAAEFGRKNGEEYYEALWETNVIGTRNVADLCAKSGARLVFASSSEIYGELPQPTLHEAMAHTFPLRHANDYAESKWVGENIIRRMASRTPLEFNVLRFFNAYGPGERPTPYRSVVSLFLWRLLMGETITVYRDYYRAFMYIDDFIPTLAEVCNTFQSGETVNIGGSEYRSVEDLARLCLEATGRGPEYIRMVGKEKHNTRNKRPDIDRAEYLFGHAPKVTLEEGVPMTAGWMLEHLGLFKMEAV